MARLDRVMPIKTGGDRWARRGAMTACLALLLWGSVAETGRLRGWTGVPGTFPVPGAAWTAAEHAAAKGDWNTVREQAVAGLAHAPWLAPGWLLLAAAAEAELGATAATVFAAEAYRRDPHGSDVLRLAVPRLLRAGALDARVGAAALLRSGQASIAAALPATPPSDWPYVFATAPRTEALEALARQGRYAWLAALATATAPALAPEHAALALAGLCRATPASCAATVAACRNGQAPCRYGLAASPYLIRAAADAAAASGDVRGAAAVARELLKLRPNSGDVAWVAAHLRAAGALTEANQLKRLHPALADR